MSSSSAPGRRRNNSGNPGSVAGENTESTRRLPLALLNRLQRRFGDFHRDSHPLAAGLDPDNAGMTFEHHLATGGVHLNRQTDLASEGI